MVRIIVSVSILLMCLFPQLIAYAQETTEGSTSQVTIISPEPGQALQGTVLIVGEVDPDNALKLELSFSFADNPRDTWFLIHEIEGAIPQEFSLEWDTNALTDGRYTIRAVLTTSEEQFISTVQGLRVRNYSVIETSTPQPTATPAPEDTNVPTITPTMSITPIPHTITPLPPNPARIDTRDIGLSLGKGAAAAFGFFAVLGLYQYVRSRRRTRDR